MDIEDRMYDHFLKHYDIVKMAADKICMDHEFDWIDLIKVVISFESRYINVCYLRELKKFTKIEYTINGHPFEMLL